jgi:lysylphosphatidylglycerol synthetase-like protein (DUF2156 family)
LGNAFYNTSVEVMKKHVSTRLWNPWGKIKYYWFVDSEGNVLWFVNYFENDDKSYLEIRWSIDNGLSDDQLDALINHCVALKNEKGYKRLTMELSEFDQKFASALQKIWAKNVSSNYILM